MVRIDGVKTQTNAARPLPPLPPIERRRATTAVMPGRPIDAFAEVVSSPRSLPDRERRAPDRQRAKPHHCPFNLRSLVIDEASSSVIAHVSHRPVGVERRGSVASAGAGVDRARDRHGFARPDVGPPSDDSATATSIRRPSPTSPRWVRPCRGACAGSSRRTLAKSQRRSGLRRALRTDWRAAHRVRPMARTSTRVRRTGSRAFR